MLIWFLIILSLVLSVIFFRNSVGSFSFGKLDFASFIFYKSILLQSFLGAFLIFCEIDISTENYLWGVTGHISLKTRLIGFLAVLYMMIMLPVGMSVANKIFLGKFNVRENVKKYFSQDVGQIENSSNLLLVSIIFMIFSSIAVAYTFYYLRSFPILELFTIGSGVEFALARTEAKINFQGSLFVRDVLAVNLTTFTSLILYILSQNRKDFYSIFLFLISFLLVFLILTYNLEKAPFIMYLVMLIFIKIIIMKGISWVKVLSFMLPLGLVLLLFFFITMGDVSYTEVILAFAQRLFVSQSVAIFHGFEFFPDLHPHLGYLSISNLLSKLSDSGEVIFYGRKLFELYNPYSVEFGTAGYIVGNFISEAWIRFGVWGLVLSPLYVGFFIQAINIFIFNSPKNPVYLAIYVYFMVKLPVTGEFAQFLYPVVPLSVFLFSFLFLYGVRSLDRFKVWGKN